MSWSMIGPESTGLRGATEAGAALVGSSAAG